MSNNSNLRKADKIEFDEYYTQYEYIQKEVNAYLEYNPDVFRDKTILLPCDDPEWSNFTKFFAQNFENLGLKKLISTSYAVNSKKVKYYQVSMFESESPQYDKKKTKSHGKIFTLERDNNKSNNIDIEDLEWNYLKGDGDFRSAEVKKLRDEADIIITNPPFSLFREFLSWVLEADKKFLIIGRETIISYKEVFPLIMDLKVWTGATCNSSDMVFEVPEGTIINEKDKEKAEKMGYVGNYTRLGNSCWFTNIDHGRRHENLELMSMADNLKFSKHESLRESGYEKLDNYDAINIPYTDSIPNDYDGLMAVPISFIHKYNPNQFEIVDGIGRYSVIYNEETKKAGKYLTMLNGKAKFFRIVIRRRK
ncbi:MAG: DNA methyltransferase [Clostridia bacterium]|nr:DNA methyltransferase [Clostridia bacterium]